MLKKKKAKASAKKPAKKVSKKTAALKVPAPLTVAKRAAPIKKLPETAPLIEAVVGTTEADKMAAKQRDISVSEFFLKNRHLLGFDNAKKALLTTVREAVDNSLDACEEAKILPEILIEI